MSSSKKGVEAPHWAGQLPQIEEEDDAARIKISITVPPAVLERIDAYRRRRGGLNRSALFSLAADWFMDEHPVKKN